MRKASSGGMEGVVPAWAIAFHARLNKLSAIEDKCGLGGEYRKKCVWRKANCPKTVKARSGTKRANSSRFIEPTPKNGFYTIRWATLNGNRR
jgi:hypothetical protein